MNMQQQALFFLNQTLKKNLNSMSYLVMMLIKMRLLIFLILNRYRIACIFME